MCAGEMENEHLRKGISCCWKGNFHEIVDPNEYFGEKEQQESETRGEFS